MPDTPRTPAEWADVLKRDWERRAQHPSRDFFVASHPGWDDPDLWERKAKIEADAMLLGMDDDALRKGEMLEIGCGVGRLTSPYLDRLRSYTGIDISEGMIEEGRRRHAETPNSRFFLCDGLSIPAEARDREYHLILAVGVFIHLPENVISAWVEDGYRLLKPGGMLRFQVLADLQDPTGIVCQEAAEKVHEEAVDMAEQVTGEQLELIDDTPYMGKRFGYEELRSFLTALTPGDVELLRTDLVHIYGSITRVG